MIIGYDATSAFCEPETGNGYYSKILFKSLVGNSLIKKIKAIYPEKSLSVELSFLKKVDYVPIKNFTISDRHRSCYDSIKKKKQLLTEYSTKNIDIFIGPDFTLPYLDCPFVVTFHDFGFLNYPKFYNKITVRHLTYICKKATKTASGILLDSNAMIEEFKQKFPYCKIPLYIIPIVPKQLKLNIEFTTHKLPSKYLLTVGDISPKKDQKTLIKALKIIKEKHNFNYKVVMVGRSLVDFYDLRSFAKKIKLDKDVIFLDNVVDSELANIYKNSSIYISCSLDEGFGLTPFEAAQFNIPIIVSDISVNRETLKNGALFFIKKDANALARAILKITKDNKLKSRLIKAARDRLSYYSIERFNNRVSEMLIDIKSRL